MPLLLQMVLEHWMSKTRSKRWNRRSMRGTSLSLLTRRETYSQISAFRPIHFMLVLLLVLQQLCQHKSVWLRSWDKQKNNLEKASARRVSDKRGDRIMCIIHDWCVPNETPSLMCVPLPDVRQTLPLCLDFHSLWPTPAGRLLLLLTRQKADGDHETRESSNWVNQLLQASLPLPLITTMRLVGYFGQNVLLSKSSALSSREKQVKEILSASHLSPNAHVLCYGCLFQAVKKSFQIWLSNLSLGSSQASCQTLLSPRFSSLFLLWLLLVRKEGVALVTMQSCLRDP